MFDNRRQDGEIKHVNLAVTNKEDETFDNVLTAGISQLSLKDQTGIPKRPAYGTKGKRITLWANYFEMVIQNKAASFYRYNVDLVRIESKKKDSKGKDAEVRAPTGKKLERCMRLLLQELPNTISVATDYRKTLITPQLLKLTKEGVLVQYYSENDAGPSPTDPRYLATIKLTGTFTFGDLLDHLCSTDLSREGPAAREQILQAANIVIASGLKQNSDNIITKSNKYFLAKGNLVESSMLVSGLEAFRGYFMSVRAATCRMLLNVQVQHVAIWKSQPLIDLVRKLQNDAKTPEEIHRFVAGLTVQVIHLGNRIKKVAGLAMKNDGRGSAKPPRIQRDGANANQVEFWKETPEPGCWITIADYFKETYGSEVLPNTPLVNLGSKSHPTYMPSEKCIIKELQTYDKKLSPADTAKMINFAVRNAADNAQSIAGKGRRLLHDNSQTLLGAFGVEVGDSLIVVNARVLDAVKPGYFQAQIAVPQGATWNMANKQFNFGAKVDSWAFVWIRYVTVNKDKRGQPIFDNKGKPICTVNGGGFKDKAEVNTVIGDFVKTLRNSGCDVVRSPILHEFDIHNPRDPGPEIDRLFAGAPEGIKLFLVILPEQSTALYNAVKRAGDITYGIHTVSVVANGQKFCKGLAGDRTGNSVPNAQYHANVALKLNLKLGGRNQVLSKSDRGFISEGKTMLVGLDVTHPAPGSAQAAPSVSSITASIDSYLCQWPADVSIQPRSKEMIEGLKNMFKSRLVLWRKYQTRYPDEIIVYRDGVGDSMYDLVRTQELPQIREACRETYSAAETQAGKPYISIIICGKRHHTRFYPTNENEVDKKTGIMGTQCGTIVDRGVTESRVWDFYLQAHAALKGTARPAHYVVIHDEVFRRRATMEKKTDARTVAQRAADEVERLTHAMCYTFGRATKAVSLCPPAYYADLVCERSRLWLSGVFDERSVVSSQAEARDQDVRVHDNLKDTMFYL